MKFLCVVVAVIAVAQAEYSSGMRDAFDIYKECSKSEGFSPCLKMKAIGVLDRLGRMKKFSIADGVTIVHEVDTTPALTNEQLEATLPRALDAKDAALSDIALNKVSGILDTSNIQISLAKFMEDDDNVEESRKKKGGKKGMMGMGMLMAASMAAILPLKIAVVAFIAKKALIIAKIALLISGIIAVKKLLASKGGSGGGGGGHGGGHGGWQSSGGGWDKRSFEEANNLAYSAYKPQ